MHTDLLIILNEYHVPVGVQSDLAGPSRSREPSLSIARSFLAVADSFYLQSCAGYPKDQNKVSCSIAAIKL